MELIFSYQEKILQCSTSKYHDMKMIFKAINMHCSSKKLCRCAFTRPHANYIRKKQHPPMKKVVFSLERRAFSISIRIALERYL